MPSGDVLLRELLGRRTKIHTADKPPPIVHDTRVHICGGERCRRLGGDAACLEIEELLLEHELRTPGHRVRIACGGCCSQCEHAPVVQIATTDAQRQSVTTLVSEVNTPQQCEAVLATLAGNTQAEANSAPASPTPADSIRKMKLRKADALRWDGLRCMSRTDPGSQREGTRLLLAAIEQERLAAAQDTERLARAQRRAERLRARFGTLSRPVGGDTPLGGA